MEMFRFGFVLRGLVWIWVVVKKGMIQHRVDALLSTHSILSQTSVSFMRVKSTQEGEQL